MPLGWMRDMKHTYLKNGLILCLAAFLFLSLAPLSLANHVPPSRYARWHTILDSYPGGSFWSPQPVASTPIYNYYNDDYRGYNYPYRYSDSFGRYGYNRGYSDYYDYPNYYDYPRNRYDGNYQDGYFQDPNCRAYDTHQYNSQYDTSQCRGRIVYPQGEISYPYNSYNSYNDPYYSTRSSSDYYPNYLKYGWE